MEARHIDLYEEALEHYQKMANESFDKVLELESKLLLANAEYKHFKEESERLQIMIKNWKEKVK